MHKVTASARTAKTRISITTTRVVYVEKQLRFTSTKVTSVVVNGKTATLRGAGVLNGKRVAFRVVVVSGKASTYRALFGKVVRAGRLSGTVVVR